MKIYYPLPGLPRNGGIKVVIQHVHLLNQIGFESYVLLPELEDTPYPAYKFAKFMRFEDSLRLIEREDIFVFTWAASIRHFWHLGCRFLFFSQGVINTTDPIPHQVWLNDRFELLTIGKHSRDFFLYGFGKESKVVNNWIDAENFHPESDTRLRNRVGMMKHRNYFDSKIAESILERGWDLHEINGTEKEVADKLRTCSFFVSCSTGVYNGFDHAEGFALPSAEAMACGCFLVTYNNQGCLEYAMDEVNCLIAWENTPSDLLAKLKVAFDCPHGERIRENGCLTIRNRFNVLRIRSQLLRALGLYEAEA